MLDYVWVSLRGFCMGAADVVPGVSGGTMAFILGIYDELLHAISAVNLDFIRKILTFKWRAAFSGFPWRFLLSLGIGILLAIFTLAEALSYALHNHPTLVWAFFFGLVLASITLVSKRVNRWTPLLMVVSVLVAGLVYWLIGVSPVETPNSPVFLFFSGFFAICAMILPGISGAFILVLLGKYGYILDAIIRFDIAMLAIFAAGCVVGLMSFVRILRRLLKHYHDPTVAVLMGMMLGSLRKVWPWKAIQQNQVGQLGESDHIQEILVFPATFTLEVGAAIGLAFLGVVMIMGMHYQANRMAKIPSDARVE